MMTMVLIQAHTLQEVEIAAADASHEIRESYFSPCGGSAHVDYVNESGTVVRLAYDTDEEW